MRRRKAITMKQRKKLRQWRANRKIQRQLDDSAKQHLKSIMGR